MQKVVNVLAVASSVVSLAVVGFGGYVFINKDSIIDGVKQQAMDAVLGGMGGGGLPAAELPVGSNDLAPSAPQSELGGGGAISGLSK